ncbi:MAG: LolA-like outer membrane lipoprotein chaperone [Campylobacterota bacterium]|nr:LolA-like outer membrane lipoprotein chaperone [Campylobacterota bacterium]
MKYLFILLLLLSTSYASLNRLTSFKADFTQTITDDKNKALIYTGHIVASKPQHALWNYIQPIKKDIYINISSVTIVEPEIEQVIIRRIESNFNFFNMIENAKHIKEDIYEANHKESVFTIRINNKLIESISYIDEFENRVKIIFKNQKQNEKVDLNIFTPDYPLEFDIIRD